MLLIYSERRKLEGRVDLNLAAFQVPKDIIRKANKIWLANDHLLKERVSFDCQANKRLMNDQVPILWNKCSLKKDEINALMWPL